MSSANQQIVNWAGADFDAVIAFGEAHETAGVGAGERASTGSLIAGNRRLRPERFDNHKQVRQRTCEPIGALSWKTIVHPAAAMRIQVCCESDPEKP